MCQEEEEITDFDEYLNSIGIADDTIDDVKEIIDFRSPPIVNELSLQPEEPGAGESVVVTADIVSTLMNGNEKIFEAFLYYSTDYGDSWKKEPMENSRDDGRTWIGTIPGQPSGTDVIYGVQAVSIFEEMYIELVCQAGKREFVDGVNSISDECKDTGDSEICNNKYPLGCMFPMTVSPKDVSEFGETTKSISAGIDFKSTRIGYDEEKVYFNLRFKDKVSAGSLSPMNANIFVAGWLNPDKPGVGTGLEAVFRKGAIIMYTPILNTDGRCVIYQLKYGMTMEADKNTGYCDIIDDQVVFSVNKDYFEPNPSGVQEFIFLSFTMEKQGEDGVSFKDNSLFTRVSFIDREYTVR